MLKWTYSFQAPVPSKVDEAEKSLVKILELGQGDIEAGNYRDIDEFFPELDSEQSDEYARHWPLDN
ncbi:hypothetical protein OKW49_002760 [Paraburkholderia youngii]|uniref:hypothetical protein n=1 Tax=Paraburkholderia youngii TaxID=2782701 RepID=UPI003D1AE434